MGQIIDPLLTQTQGLSISITGAGSQMNTAQLQTLTYGSITVDQDVNFNSLNNIYTSSLYVSNGATLSLPNVTSYSIAIGTAGNYWQATGSGSEIRAQRADHPDRRVLGHDCPGDQRRRSQHARRDLDH